MRRTHSAAESTSNGCGAFTQVGYSFATFVILGWTRRAADSNACSTSNVSDGDSVGDVRLSPTPSNWATIAVKLSSPPR